MGPFQAGVCRVEDYYLWYSGTKDMFFAVVTILALLSMGIIYLALCKRAAKDISKAAGFRKEEDEEDGDNWPNIQPEICHPGSPDTLACANCEN